jgi:hypothetical protein
LKKQIKDIGLFIWTFFTRWQSYAADAPTWLAIDFWERYTGRTMNKEHYFLFMVGVFAVVSFFVMWREQKTYIDHNMPIIELKRNFSMLLIQGYGLGPNEVDKWNNDCLEFLEKLFGKESFEVKVYKKEETDAIVDLRFKDEKAKFALLKGGKLPHPNALFVDEPGTITYRMVVLRWAAGRFEQNNPMRRLS